MKINKLAHAISLICIAGPVFAQTASSGPANMEKVIITGSSIKRVESEGALPVQIITRQDMERQGIVSAEQLIMSLDSNGNGLYNLASNSDVVAGAARGNNGLSAANLRGQGAESTLVLLNGRRVAAYGLNGGIVDLNSIPFAAIDRVEILKDGASSLYGTDAIGGVINFITRKDYNGVTLQAFYDKTEQGGGDIARGNILAGFGNLEKDGFNVFASLSHSESKALRGSERDFVNTFQPDRGLSVDTRGTPLATVFTLATLRTILSSRTTPGGAIANGTGPLEPGGTVRMNGINPLDIPGQAGCNVLDGMQPYDERLWATPAAKYGCAWDTGRAADLQQEVKNTAAVARGTFNLGRHQLAAEFTGARVTSTKTFSNQQLSTSGTASSPLFNLVYPSTGSSYNYVFNAIAGFFPSLEENRGQPIAFRWRCMECGPRQIETTADTARFLVSAEGPLIADWEYRTGVSRATSESKSKLNSGYFFDELFFPKLRDGTINPFLLPGQTQTQPAMDAFAASSANGVVLYGGKFTMTQGDFTASGPVFKLPAGDVMLAVGADIRREEYEFNGDERDLANRRGIFNAPFDNINALGGVSRNVKAVYAEALIPILKTLDITLAVRHDDYTGFGGTTNPKVSARFVPFQQLLFRGSYGTGFRVPTFNQLFNGITQSPYSGKDLADPAKCPSNVVSATPGCEAVTPTILTGGKSDLGPEESKQGTVGVVWAPVPEFSASADWWKINREGTIQSLDLTAIVNNSGLFPSNFIRDAAGTLLAIDNRWVNAGETSTSGIDVGAKLNGKLGSGRYLATIDGTYLLEKKSRLIANVAFGPSEINQFTRAGDLGLRWKHTATFTYTMGDWSGTLIQQFRSGYTDAVLPGVANGTVVPANWNAKVDSYTLYHLSATYTGIKNLSITGGVKNLFNEDPPFSAAYDGNTGAGSSWEPRVADP
ncbi:MAG: TonB-dependent receptor, partial [Betaproteobacteria bacterium]